MSIEKKKYSRTPHLPWSPGATSDDKRLSDNDVFQNFGFCEVVVTEKLDGENTTIYSDGTCHARSIDSKGHPSRDLVKKLAASVGYRLQPNIRICGENVFAKHSIYYRNLEEYFYVFGIYDGDTCQGWDDTVFIANALDLQVAPTLYHGVWDPVAVKKCWTGGSTASPGDPQEGYVVRDAYTFQESKFGECVAKYVRANHVQSEDHWMHRQMVPNKLRS